MKCYKIIFCLFLLGFVFSCRNHSGEDLSEERATEQVAKPSFFGKQADELSQSYKKDSIWQNSTISDSTVIIVDPGINPPIPPKP